MNDQERAYEALRVTNWLCACMEAYNDEVVDKFKRGTKFPYFQRFVKTDDKRNVWHLLFYILTKEMKKKCLYYTMAYTVFDVPPKRKRNDNNAGKGCILFDPITMKRMLDGDPHARGAVVEIEPHAFHRYKDRHLIIRGKEKTEIDYKLESMLKRWKWFDVAADIFGDENAKKHMRDGSIPYDVIMRGGGLLRGQMENDIFIRFTTYISEDQMFENQIERQEDMEKEYYYIKRTQKNFLP